MVKFLCDTDDVDARDGPWWDPAPPQSPEDAVQNVFKRAISKGVFKFPGAKRYFVSAHDVVTLGARFKPDILCASVPSTDEVKSKPRSMKFIVEMKVTKMLTSSGTCEGLYKYGYKYIFSRAQ
jgi:hypothetical protein